MSELTKSNMKLKYINVSRRKHKETLTSVLIKSSLHFRMFESMFYKQKKIGLWCSYLDEKFIAFSPKINKV